MKKKRIEPISTKEAQKTIAMTRALLEIQRIIEIVYDKGYYYGSELSRNAEWEKKLREKQKNCSHPSDKRISVWLGKEEAKVCSLCNLLERAE